MAFTVRLRAFAIYYLSDHLQIRPTWPLSLLSWRKWIEIAVHVWEGGGGSFWQWLLLDEKGAWEELYHIHSWAFFKKGQRLFSPRQFWVCSCLGRAGVGWNRGPFHACFTLKSEEPAISGGICSNLEHCLACIKMAALNSCVNFTVIFHLLPMLSVKTVVLGSCHSE